MKRKQVYLDDESDSLLRKGAALKGVSEASIVQEAVARYLGELERRRRKSAPDGLVACLVGMYAGDLPPDAARDHVSMARTLRRPWAVARKAACGDGLR